MNELDPDLQFIFEEPTANINFLDINLKIINDKLHFDVYTNLQILLVTVTIKVESKICKVAKSNIELSLARRIARVVSVTKIIDFKNLKITY